MSLFADIGALAFKLHVEGADFTIGDWVIACSPETRDALHDEAVSFGAPRLGRIVDLNILGVKFPIVTDEILPDGEVRIMRR